jgi:hypothetical protein
MVVPFRNSGQEMAAIYPGREFAPRGKGYPLLSSDEWHCRLTLVVDNLQERSPSLSSHSRIWTGSLDQSALSYH